MLNIWIGSFCTTQKQIGDHMEIIVIPTILILILMGAIHFYWAFGGKLYLDKVLPTIDGKLLFTPGKLLTFIVGIVLIIFSVAAYLLQYGDRNSSYLPYLGWVLFILFTIRAIGEFNVVGLFKKIKSTQFAEYDTKYFSPLCIYLALVFAILSYRF